MAYKRTALKALVLFLACLPVSLLLYGIGPWQLFRRRVYAAVMANNASLHLGLAGILLGGLFVGDVVHRTIWDLKNSGVSGGRLQLAGDALWRGHSCSWWAMTSENKWLCRCVWHVCVLQLGAPLTPRLSTHRKCWSCHANTCPLLHAWHLLGCCRSTSRTFSSSSSSRLAWGQRAAWAPGGLQDLLRVAAAAAAVAAPELAVAVAEILTAAAVVMVGRLVVLGSTAAAVAKVSAPAKGAAAVQGMQAFQGRLQGLRRDSPASCVLGLMRT
jgi:hypothetical protein